ncbi:MAG: hypothetical protein AB1442_14150 [Nitrospirota bacterium]
MANESKLIQFATKLNRLTQEGTIEWSRMDPPDSLTKATDDKIFHFFGARYKGRNLGLYEERYQTYGDYDELIWTQRWVLAFFDDEWEEAWRFPSIQGIPELAESVMYNVADVDSIIDDLLSEGGTE